MKTAIILAAGAMSLAGCVGKGAGAPEMEARGDAAAGAMGSATTDLRDGRGSSVASAEFEQEAGGVRVRLATTSMAPGSYGAHVHMVGRCDAPGFESAGAHWNPGGRQHGRDNPAGAHLGDLPNLLVGSDGRGSIEFVAAGARLAGGSNRLFDTDGAALVVHAAADDYRTDPSGNSGARIACGVLRPR